MHNLTWYNSLTKPFLNPPAWIFPPVWIILYTTIFIALIIYTIKFSEQDKLKGYVFFSIQLLLNLLWSPAFFIMHNIGLALIIVFLMDLFTILTIIKFHQISKTAGLILIPYLLWILFATYLNISYLILN